MTQPFQFETLAALGEPKPLGERLRDMFDEMMAGPTPSHRVEVVEQLERQALDATPRRTAPSIAVAAIPI